jgi:hypothetical protein
MELKDWLNSINHTKENLMEDPSNVKDYPPYIINRCMSGHVDCILYANEMNMQPHLSKDMQYAFYLNSIRKKKRFSPWIRKDKVNDIDAVKQYYGYSNEKATQSLKVLNNTQLNFIKQRLEKGGQNGRSNC